MIPNHHRRSRWLGKAQPCIYVGTEGNWVNSRRAGRRRALPCLLACLIREQHRPYHRAEMFGWFIDSMQLTSQVKVRIPRRTSHAWVCPPAIPSDFIKSGGSTHIPVTYRRGKKRSASVAINQNGISSFSLVNIYIGSIASSHRMRGSWGRCVIACHQRKRGERRDRPRLDI